MHELNRFGIYAASLVCLLLAVHAQAQLRLGTWTDVQTREFVSQYCVTCHNERLQTGGLVLDQVDFRQIAANAEVLEKVVRKVRSGQMPPEGRPRANAATTHAFALALETRLDDAAEAFPNPGRVVSRRLNRLEYVNAVYDLLGFEVDGEALLPADMAGFGFDNNADVLAITPSLMSRYIAAATKISRAAVGSPDNRPVMQMYRVGFDRRDIRAGEGLPFASLGGLAVRHTFPLDGEYVFAIRLKRHQTIETIDGIAEDEHEIEVRVDHKLVQKFAIGGKYPGPDPGQLIAVPEEDVAGQRLHAAENFSSQLEMVPIIVLQQARPRIRIIARIEHPARPRARTLPVDRAVARDGGEPGKRAAAPGIEISRGECHLYIDVLQHVFCCVGIIADAVTDTEQARTTVLINRFQGIALAGRYPSQGAG